MASRLLARAWKSFGGAEVGSGLPSRYPSSRVVSSHPIASQMDLTRGVPAVIDAPHAIASTAQSRPPFAAASRMRSAASRTSSFSKRGSIALAAALGRRGAALCVPSLGRVAPLVCVPLDPGASSNATVWARAPWPSARNPAAAAACTGAEHPGKPHSCSGGDDCGGAGAGGAAWLLLRMSAWTSLATPATACLWQQYSDSLPVSGSTNAGCGQPGSLQRISPSTARLPSPAPVLPPASSGSGLDRSMSGTTWGVSPSGSSLASASGSDSDDDDSCSRLLPKRFLTSWVREA
eukprot:1105333-Rhodomonas_salina.3